MDESSWKRTRASTHTPTRTHTVSRTSHPCSECGIYHVGAERRWHMHTHAHTRIIMSKKGNRIFWEVREVGKRWQGWWSWRDNQQALILKDGTIQRRRREEQHTHTESSHYAVCKPIIWIIYCCDYCYCWYDMLDRPWHYPALLASAKATHWPVEARSHARNDFSEVWLPCSQSGFCVSRPSDMFFFSMRMVVCTLGLLKLSNAQIRRNQKTDMVELAW